MAIVIKDSQSLLISSLQCRQAKCSIATKNEKTLVNIMKSNKRRRRRISIQNGRILTRTTHTECEFHYVKEFFSEFELRNRFQVSPEVTVIFIGVVVAGRGEFFVVV